MEVSRRGLGGVVGWEDEDVGGWGCCVEEETGRSEEEEKEYGVGCVEEEERLSRRRRHRSAPPVEPVEKEAEAGGEWGGPEEIGGWRSCRGRCWESPQ